MSCHATKFEKVLRADIEVKACPEIILGHNYDKITHLNQNLKKKKKKKKLKLLISIYLLCPFMLQS